MHYQESIAIDYFLAPPNTRRQFVSEGHAIILRSHQILAVKICFLALISNAIDRALVLFKRSIFIAV